MDDDSIVKITALRGKIKELGRQQANLVAELREYQPVGDEEIDRQWRAQLRASFATVSTQLKNLQTQLADLTAEPATPAAADPSLLDGLPVIGGDLGKLPEDVERELFHDFQLQVRYHHLTGRVTLRVTIDGQALPRLAASSRAIVNGVNHTPTNARRPPAAPAAGGPGIFSLAVSAPGGAPTCESLLPSGVVPGAADAPGA